jgi:sporulation protein YlmC with PRC-barrel domain
MCRWKWASLLAAALAAPLPAIAAWVGLASEILGKPVVAEDGARLGRIQDLVMDLRNSRVSYAVVGFDGWGNVGERLHAVPVGALELGPDGAQVRLEDDHARIPDREGRELSAHTPLRQFVPASQVIGRSVDDRTGTHAGEIEDALIDMESGVVLSLLFDYDEAWGLDQPALRMAPQVFTFPEDGGPAVVNMARERLEDPDHSR